MIYTDGAARGNPGPSASGYVVYIGGNKAREDFLYNGDATNNFAEYRAIKMALEWCGANIDTKAEVELVSDSELVVRQINGRYKVKSKLLLGMNQRVKALASQFKDIKLKNAPRTEKNISYVDGQLNALLDKMAKQRPGKA